MVGVIMGTIGVTIGITSATVGAIMASGGIAICAAVVIAGTAVASIGVGAGCIGSRSEAGFIHALMPNASVTQMAKNNLILFNQLTIQLPK